MLERLPCSEASSLSSTSDSVVGAPLRLLLLVEEEEEEPSRGRRGSAATARLLSLASSGRRLWRLPCLLPATLTCLQGGGGSVEEVSGVGHPDSGAPLPAARSSP